METNPIEAGGHSVSLGSTAGVEWSRSFASTPSRAKFPSWRGKTIIFQPFVPTNQFVANIVAIQTPQLSPEQFLGSLSIPPGEFYHVKPALSRIPNLRLAPRLDSES